MKRTNRLGLPIFDNPNTDRFGLDEWNYANETIDEAYDEIDNIRKEIPKINASAEIVEARKGSKTLGEKIGNIDKILGNTTSQLEQKASINDLASINTEVSLKLNKDEVSGGIYPLVVSNWTYLYANLPSANTSNKGGYLYCTDGNGVHGSGNYVSNGVSWYFGGTGDKGYNVLKKNIVSQQMELKPSFTLGSITSGEPWDTNKGLRTEWLTKVNKGDTITLLNPFAFGITVTYYLYGVPHYGSANSIGNGTIANSVVIDQDCYVGFRIMTEGDSHTFTLEEARNCTAISISRNKVDFYSEKEKLEKEIKLITDETSKQNGYAKSSELFDYVANGYDGAGLYTNTRFRIGSKSPFYITSRTRMVVTSDDISVNLLYGILENGTFVFQNSTGYIDGKSIKYLEPSDTRVYLLSARYVGETVIPKLIDFKKHIVFLQEEDRLDKLNKLSGLYSSLSNGFFDTLDLFNIVQGGYDGAGIKTTTSTRVRSEDFFSISSDVVIKNANKDIGVNLITFDKSKNNLQVSQWAWKKGLFEAYVPYNSNYVYKLTASFIDKNGNIDAKTITPKDLTNNLSSFKADNNIVINKNEVPGDWKKEINNLQKAQGTNFTFAVQTDTHFTDNEPYLSATNMKNLTHYLGLDFICNLGDMVRGYEFDTTESMQNAITDIMERYTNGVSCPFLYAIGNHEDNVMYTTNSVVGSGNNSLDEVILHDELYAKIMKPVKNTASIVQPNKSFHYYTDFDDARVVVLNVRDIAWKQIAPNDIDVSYYRISEAQIQWLESEALNTTKPVLVLCHVPLVSELTNDTVVNGQLALSKIVNFKNNGGEVIGICYGHVHKQDSVLVNGINHIIFANGGLFAEIVIVDTNKKTIQTKMIGDYGTKINRSFSY